MEIINLLDNNSHVEAYTVLDRKIFEKGYYLKIRIILKDESELYVKEYIDEKERNYSYHWQNKQGILILRWDNAPHYHNLKTFPHHKHVEGKILESNEITLKEILAAISKIIQS